MSAEEAVEKAQVYGLCTACRSVEVALIEQAGTRDLSSIGEHPEYPIGYGCELCS